MRTRKQTEIEKGCTLNAKPNDKRVLEFFSFQKTGKKNILASILILLCTESLSFIESPSFFSNLFIEGKRTGKENWWQEVNKMNKTNLNNNYKTEKEKGSLVNNSNNNNNNEGAQRAKE